MGTPDPLGSRDTEPLVPQLLGKARQLVGCLCGERLEHRDATGVEPEPVGVDGCGAPVHRGTVVGLARAFSRLTTDPSMEPVATAMTRYGSLVGDNTRSDGKVAASWGGPVKVGAEGCIAMARHGVAIATKSLDGSDSIAVAAALEAASEVGMMGGGMDEWLDDARHPAVRGGGRIVGRLERVA